MPRQRLSHFVAAVIFAVASAGFTYQAADAHPAHVLAHSAAIHQSSAAPSLAMSPAGLKREVFGFALASSLSDPSVGYPSWKFSLLGTVAFFALHVGANGGISQDSAWSVWNSSALTGLLTAAHSAGTKVVVTIDLQDFQSGTPNMCAGLVNRATTVSQTVAQVVAKGVDGVNVDYEGLNGTCPNGQTSQSMLTAFIQQLRAALPSGSYLSIDTYASSAIDTLGFFDIAGLNQYVDAFFVMAYDLEYSNWRHAPVYCSSFCLGPTAPLTGYYYNDTSTAAQYTAVVPASKVILGVPYYGRKACVGSTNPNQYPTGSVIADGYQDASGESTAGAVLSGSYVAHRDANDPAGQERWDTWTNTSLGCVRELYWDDVTSLGRKYDLVNQDGLRGVGIWTLNYGGGAPELWSALQSHFAGCTAVSTSATPASPTLAGTVVSLSASASCPNSSPLYEFWILDPGASLYTLVQPYSANPVFKWPTVGISPGTYRVNVWVRDSSSAGAYANSSGRWDAYNANLVYTVTSVPCGAVAESASATAAMAGLPVTITAGASGCPNPQYEFWILKPGASLYTLAQPYGASSQLDWATSGLAPGTYRINVWVHDQTSRGVYGNPYGRWDAYNATQVVTLTAGCPSATESASPASPAPAGVPVTITAGAPGCVNPTYEFWVLAPGASLYTLAQPYSASPTLSWSTASLAPGTYRINVWVRTSAGAGTYRNSYGSWDAYFANLLYTVTPSCKSVSETSPATTAQPGATVGVTASASGCPRPQYEFWILAPGASLYRLAQGYSASPTLSWSTSGLAAGTYRITVWARDAASSGVSSNAYGSWDAYDAHLVVTIS